MRIGTRRLGQPAPRPVPAEKRERSAQGPRTGRGSTARPRSRPRDRIAATLRSGRTEDVRRAIRFAVSGHLGALGRITLAAFLGGLTEALFLVTVTRIAFAVTDGHHRVGVVAGWYVSVDQALLLTLVLIVGRFGLATYANRQSVILSTDVVAEVRHRLAENFLASSWPVQAEQRSGSLQQLMTGFAGSTSQVMNSVADGLVATANLGAMLGMAVAVSPAGALLMVGSVGMFSLLLRPLRAAVGRRARASTIANLDFAVAVSEVADLGLELHVFHVHGPARARVGQFVEQVRRTGRRVGFAGSMATPVYTSLAYITLLGALAAVAASNTHNLTSLGAAMLVMLRSLSYGQAIQGAYMSMIGSAPAIEQLQERLQVYEDGRRIDGGQPVGRVGTIRAEGVSFAYPGGPTVLRDISFTIEPNEIVGIVGPSGSGKSTLVQLLLGLRDPQVGRISADGRDIAELSRAEWAAKVAFVPQAAHLITGSIADNIRFMRDGVTMILVEEASRLAHLHDEVVAFTEGYEHQVGEHGGHLSGGQQQRLCIARALLARPAVLILDEPTSALDVRSEHLIRTTLLDLKRGMTVIIIAHRMSTLAVCDRLMVIQDGALRAFGTPSELERSSAFYRDVLKLSALR